MSEWKDDAALNRQMREPFPTPDEANAAMEAFLDDVAGARKKHRVSDVYLVVAFNYLATDGEETRGMACWGCGDGMRHEQMAAYALGTTQADRRQIVDKLISRAAK